MKKQLVALTCLVSSLSLFSAPNDPMENYTPSNVAEYEVSRLWRSMRTDVKGDDCYRRAQLWTYEMYKDHSVKSSKIFIHYTDKFNRELDNMGRKRGLNWFSKKTFSVDGVSKRNIKMVRSNITWDYHVAPLLNVNGKEMVMDRYLDLPYDAKYPYSEHQAWRLSARPASAQEWVEALTVRGELLWKVRRQELINDMKELKGKIRNTSSSWEKSDYQSELRDMQKSFKRLGMDKARSIDIKCKRITSMVELDAAQSSEWCFYSVAPMYYYNEIDLRYLAYGNTGLRYNMAVSPRYATEANFRDGRRYIQTRFNQSELEDAKKELKHNDNDNNGFRF